MFLKRDGQTWGLFLETDSRVEHERGIAELYRRLGAPLLQVNGLENRTVRRADDVRPEVGFSEIRYRGVLLPRLRVLSERFLEASSWHLLSFCPKCERVYNRKTTHRYKTRQPFGSLRSD